MPNGNQTAVLTREAFEAGKVFRPLGQRRLYRFIAESCIMVAKWDYLDVLLDPWSFEDGIRYSGHNDEEFIVCSDEHITQDGAGLMTITQYYSYTCFELVDYKMRSADREIKIIGNGSGR